MQDLIKVLDYLLEGRKDLTLDTLVFEGIGQIDQSITGHYKGKNKLDAYIESIDSVEEGVRDGAANNYNHARENDMYLSGFRVVFNWRTSFMATAKNNGRIAMTSSYDKAISDLCIAVKVLKDGLNHVKDCYENRSSSRF